MANAWKREKSLQFHLSKTICLFFICTLLFLMFFIYFTAQPSNPITNPTFKSDFRFCPIPPFNCLKCPQSHPVIASLVEGLPYPFLYSLADLGTLPDKPHKNIVRMLKGKLFRKPDISVSVQEVLEKLRGEGRGNGVVVDVGANVGMASFAAAAMGFRVLAFEPVFENLQRICDGIYLNRVGDLVTVFEAVASDRSGNITFHKCGLQVKIDKLFPPRVWKVIRSQVCSTKSTRPTYPTQRFSKLAALTPQHSLAWDFGTGKGQAALAVTLSLSLID